MCVRRKQAPAAKKNLPRCCWPGSKLSYLFISNSFMHFGSLAHVTDTSRRLFDKISRFYCFFRCIFIFKFYLKKYRHIQFFLTAGWRTKQWKRHVEIEIRHRNLAHWVNSDGFEILSNAKNRCVILNKSCMFLTLW